MTRMQAMFQWPWSGVGSFINHVDSWGGRGVSQETVLWHKSYLVKVTTKGGQKYPNFCPRGLWMAHVVGSGQASSISNQRVIDKNHEFLKMAHNLRPPGQIRICKLKVCKIESLQILVSGRLTIWSQYIHKVLDISSNQKSMFEMKKIILQGIS